MFHCWNYYRPDCVNHGEPPYISTGLMIFCWIIIFIHGFTVIRITPMMTQLYMEQSFIQIHLGIRLTDRILTLNWINVFMLIDILNSQFANVNFVVLMKHFIYI